MMQQVVFADVVAERDIMAARVAMSGECVKGFGDEIAAGETKKDRQRQKRFLARKGMG
jgi:hypothetical protein